MICKFAILQKETRHKNIEFFFSKFKAKKTIHCCSQKYKNVSTLQVFFVYSLPFFVWFVSFLLQQSWQLILYTCYLVKRFVWFSGCVLEFDWYFVVVVFVCKVLWKEKGNSFEIVVNKARSVLTFVPTLLLLSIIVKKIRVWKMTRWNKKKTNKCNLQKYKEESKKTATFVNHSGAQ